MPFKPLCRPLYAIRSHLTKMLLIMKMAAILLLAAFMQASAGTYGQTVTISVRNVPVEVVFKEIFRQTGVSFMYNESLFDSHSKVSLRVREASIATVLDQCLKGTPFVYSIEHNTISIRKVGPETPAPDSVAQAPPPQEVLKGKVTDSTGKPIAGVSVTLRGTSYGTVTGTDGTFSLSLSTGTHTGSLVFSYVGMESRTIPIGKRDFFDVVLKTEATAMNDVVVIAYGTVRKKDLTGSIETINNEDLNKGAPTNIVSALQGKVAGAVITQSDGAPGAGLNIQIRGINTFLGGSQPLYVIDGIPYVMANSNATPSSVEGSEQSTINALSFINPADIESISILKDASATAIYGSRGANGVVIITTKKGKRGEDRVEFNINNSVARVIKEIKMLDAYGYASMQNEAVTNANYFEPGPTPRTLPYPGDWQTSPTNIDSVIYYKGPKDYIGHSTDWQKAIFQQGKTQNYSLDFSGGGDAGSYLISGHYLQQTGVIINSHYTQYGVSANLNRNVKKWLTVGSNTTFNHSTDQMVKTNNEDLSGGVGVVKAALAFPPTATVYDSGTSTFTAATQVSNPVLYATTVKNQIMVDQVFSSNYVQATLLKGLTFRENLGISYFNNQREQYYPRTTYEGLSDLGLAYQSQGWYNSLTQESILTYMRTIHQNVLTALVGQSYENDESSTKSQEANDFVNDILQDNNMAGGQDYTQPQTNKTKSDLVSFYGRLTDTWKERYLFTVSFREDGTSKFAPQNHWSFFPSGAFAWIVSNEPFMKMMQSTFNDVKLRTSYGRTGNQAVNPYETMDQLVPTPYVFGGSLANGYSDNVYAGPGNINLRWETTDQYDAGLDFGVLKNLITFHGDVYYKRTHHLLQNITIPPSSGFSSQLVNRGEIDNKGLELTVGASPIVGKTFSWNISGNISFNRNKIASLGGGVTQQFATRIETNGDQPFIQKVGQPIGALYGYVEQGIYKNLAEVQADPVENGQGSAIIQRMVGEIRYADLNHDGVITPADETLIGNVNPKFTYGLTNNFTYKRFDLNILIQGVYGNDIVNMNTYYLSNIGQFNNVTQSMWNNRWTFANWDHATDPKAEQQYWRYFLFTRRFIENGSYIRLKNVSLGYNFQLRTKAIQTLRAFFSGTNLITITKYSGYDPDINGYGEDPSRRGVDMGGYPSAKTYNLGIQCTF